jgi:hypothetical protein
MACSTETLLVFYRFLTKLIGSYLENPPFHSGTSALFGYRAKLSKQTLALSGTTVLFLDKQILKLWSELCN